MTRTDTEGARNDISLCISHRRNPVDGRHIPIKKDRRILALGIRSGIEVPHGYSCRVLGVDRLHQHVVALRMRACEIRRGSLIEEQGGPPALVRSGPEQRGLTLFRSVG